MKICKKKNLLLGIPFVFADLQGTGGGQGQNNFIFFLFYCMSSIWVTVKQRKKLLITGWALRSAPLTLAKSQGFTFFFDGFPNLYFQIFNTVSFLTMAYSVLILPIFLLCKVLNTNPQRESTKERQEEERRVGEEEGDV